MQMNNQNSVEFSNQEVAALIDSNLEGGLLMATLIADLEESRAAGCQDGYIHNSFGRDGGYFMPKETVKRRLIQSSVK